MSEVIYGIRRVFTSAVLLCLFGTALAHPPVPGNEHTHNASNIYWELDGTKDGSSAHNHFDSRSFNGAETLAQPAGAGACWDNSTVRVDGVNDFTKGHCFVNPIQPSARPTYHLSSSIPTEAKERIRDAFDAFNAINVVHPDYEMSAEFVETSSSSGADVIVRWVAMPDINHGGATELNETSQNYLDFDKDLDWSFQRSKSGVPSDKWHFFSVALHEVGHVYGLGHQPFWETDDLMHAPVGEPLNESGVHFDTIDNDSIEGIKRLYTQPKAQAQCPPPQPLARAEWEYCVGAQAVYHVTWQPGAGTVPPVTYEIERRAGTTWYPFYEGSLSSLTYACSYSTYFRVRVISSGGCPSVWRYFWANHNCAWGGDPD